MIVGLPTILALTLIAVVTIPYYYYLFNAWRANETLYYTGTALVVGTEYRVDVGTLDRQVEKHALVVDFDDVPAG